MSRTQKPKLNAKSDDLFISIQYKGVDMYVIASLEGTDDDESVPNAEPYTCYVIAKDYESRAELAPCWSAKGNCAWLVEQLYDAGTLDEVVKGCV